MSLTVQQCAQRIRQEYPGFYPYAYVEFHGSYIFNLIQNGQDPESAYADFHMVDPNTGEVSGNVPTLKLLGNKEFRDKWRNANLVKDAEEAKHSFFQSYRVRRGGETDVLAHYGIPGQRWGVSNGPPYPLDARTRQAVAKKAKAQDTEVRGDLTETAAEAVSTIAMAAAVIGVRMVAVHNAAKNFQKQSTANARLLSDAYLGDISQHKDFSDQHPPKLISGTHTPDQDMAAVNPKYKDASVPGTNNNCVLCSVTYDLRRRGYDVTAKIGLYGNIDKLLTKEIYDHPKREKLGGRTFDDVFAKGAKKFPEGSRGLIGVNGYFGGGHSMAFEVVNGKFIVRCAQSNEIMTPMKLDGYGFNPRTADVIRTDHLKVKMNGVGKACNELKPDWKSKLKTASTGNSTSSAPKQTTIGKPMTQAEKQKSLEAQWKKNHKGPMDAEARKSMDNWVNGHMWSMPEDDESRVYKTELDGISMMYTNFNTPAAGYIVHWGIKGQRKGVRRFQYENGSYTEEGKKRYGRVSEKNARKGAAEKKAKKGEAEEDSGSSKWKAKDASKLSDAELNRRNSRLQRERQYRDMTTPQWKKETQQILKDAGKKIFVATIVGIAAKSMRDKYPDILSHIGKFASTTVTHALTSSIQRHQKN